MEESVLQKKKILVKFVGKKTGFNASQPGHVLSGGKLQGTYTRFTAPMNKSGTVKEFLKPEEVKFFSDRLGTDIAFTNKSYWEEFAISLTKEDMILDLEDPMQNLQFKALHHYPSVICANPADLTKRSTYQWCLYNTDDEANTKASELDSKMKAYMNLGRYETNRDVLAYLYKFIEGRIISRETSLIDVKSKFLDVVSKQHVKFNQLIEDPLLDEKVIINNAFELGIVSEKSGEYTDIKSGKKLCDKGRATLQVAAEYISSVVNQDLRLELEARIKVAKDSK